MDSALKDRPEGGLECRTKAVQKVDLGRRRHARHSPSIFKLVPLVSDTHASNGAPVSEPCTAMGGGLWELRPETPPPTKKTQKKTKYHAQMAARGWPGYLLPIAFESEGFVQKELSQLLAVWSKLWADNGGYTMDDAKQRHQIWANELALIHAKYLAQAILDNSKYAREACAVGKGATATIGRRCSATTTQRGRGVQASEPPLIRRIKLRARPF